MKNKLILVFILNFLIVKAQNQCDRYLDFMASSIEKEEIDKAKSDMKAFVACNEENLSSKKYSNFKIINSMDFMFKFGDKFIVCKSDSKVDNFKTNYKYWVLDKDYKIIKQLHYDRIIKGLENQLIVSIKKYNKSNDIKFETGIIDENLNIVVPLNFYSISIFNQNYITSKGEVYWSLKNGLIDKNGKTLLEPIYKIYKLYEGISRISIDNKEGFIDSNGKIIIPIEFDNYHSWDNNYSTNTLSSNFIDGLAIVYKSKKFGYIDKNGNPVVPIEFDDIQLFSEGLAGVMIKTEENKGWLWGFVNKQGELILEPTYSEVSKFNEGLSRVKNKHGYVEDGYTFINVKGKEVFSINCDVITTFHNGIATAKNYNKGEFIINNIGECIKNCHNQK